MIETWTKEQIKINIEHYKDTFDKFPCKSHQIGLQYKIAKSEGIVWK